MLQITRSKFYIELKVTFLVTSRTIKKSFLRLFINFFWIYFTEIQNEGVFIVTWFFVQILFVNYIRICHIKKAIIEMLFSWFLWIGVDPRNIIRWSIFFSIFSSFDFYPILCFPNYYSILSDINLIIMFQFQ